MSGSLVEVVAVDDRTVAREVGPDRLATLVAQVADFIENKRDDPKPKVTPRRTMLQVLAGPLAEFRSLVAVVDHPIVRQDGSWVRLRGYDDESHRWVNVPPSFPEVPSAPTKDHAVDAMRVVRKVVEEFPFVEPERGFATWLAFVLTLTLRTELRGPFPLFLIFAPTADGKGLGKTKLALLGSLIVNGRSAPVTNLQQSKTKVNDEEIERTLTTFLFEPAVVFDNLRLVGGGPLDAFITSRSWSAREMRTSRARRTDIMPVVAATANAPQIVGDTDRRCVVLPLHGEPGRWREKQFTTENIEQYVEDRRHDLLAAVLTIVAAYRQARPTAPKLRPFGSFETWRVVREMVVWLGLPDPLVLWEDVTGQPPDAVEVLRAEGAVSRATAKTAKELLESTNPVTTAWRALLGEEQPTVQLLSRRLKAAEVSTATTNKGAIFWTRSG
ncbi:MAG: hypothetical protein H6722_13740 [Sandaracinus sp.]|nr:hypothetical protein [Sandaracinus sp.]MCB9613507.1 hypothetical protein [Sandaracinus sp.]MCB9619732.1 hypothetical protein [Sandaracinus sp.]